MPENKKGKEKGVEKERGTGVLRGEHDELEASEMENISGGTPDITTPPGNPSPVPIPYPIFGGHI